MTDKTHMPDLGAIAPNEFLRRDTATEKRNEIPGRQIAPAPENIVEIRSAVHSNYAGMVAMVGADNRVYLGQSVHYDGMGHYDNSDGSLCHVSDNTELYYFLCGEGWVKSQDEMLDHGLTLAQYHEFTRLRDGVLRQFEPKPGREILFADQPFQPPENYLRNVEMTVEGNYNMLDGRINNEPPQRPDLTDGQTWEEIAELAPETLPDERPSVLEQLKGERPEHEARQVKAPVPERGL